MEPITTITGALLAQFQASTFITSVISGTIGNASYAFLNNSTNRLYKKLRNDVGEPHNHDIQKAVREAYLKATLIAVNHIKSNDKWYDKFIGNDSLFLNEIEKYIKKELKLISQNDIHFAVTDFDKEYQALLFIENKEQSNLLAEMIVKLKESLFVELENNGCLIETNFKTAISEGWRDKDKNVDWYKLTCAFFTEELKTNTRLSTIIQTEYLKDINETITDVSISVDNIQAHLEPYYVQYKELILKIEILNIVTETKEIVVEVKESTDKLPDTMRQIVREELDKKGITSNFPDFNLPGRHQKLLSKIEQLNVEVEQIKIEIEDLKTDVEEATENNKERKQRLLNRAEINFINLAQQKQKTENELQNFISNVLNLAKQFSQQSDTLSPRLEKARALFNNGRYEEADAVLNERDIYDDIKKHKEKAVELANELTVKAQTTLINKSKNWFEQANKFYKDAAIIDENGFTCYNYGYFLQLHRQILEAIDWYEKSLMYITDDYHKATVLNNLGTLQFEKNEFDKAEINFNKALNIRKQLAEKNPKTNLFDVAMTLNNLAGLQNRKNEVDKAETNYNEALGIFKQFANAKLLIYFPEIAMTLNNLAVLQYNKNEFDKAEKNYNEALGIYKQLAETIPQTYLSGVALTLNNLASLQKDKNEFDKSETNYNEALGMRRQLAKDKPQTNLSDVAMTLNNLALLQYNRNELDKAETNYNETLGIYKQLADINPQTYLLNVAMALNNLALLQSRKNEFGKAETNYNEALSIYEQLAKGNPQTYLSDVAMTLNNLALLQRDKKDFAKTEISYNKALDIYKQLAETNPQTYLINYARVAVGMAWLYKEGIVNKDKSILYAKEAIKGFTPSGFVPFATKGKKAAEYILQYWKDE